MISLRDEMDRLLGGSFICPLPRLSAFFGGDTPALDMGEIGSEVVAGAAVPGVKPEVRCSSVVHQAGGLLGLT